MPAEVGESGFTLVEVLVALVASALILAIVLEGASMARLRERKAEHERAAVFLARSLIVERSARPLDIQPVTGSTGPLHWRVTERMIARDGRGFYGLMAIRAEIFDDKDRPIFAVGTRRLKSRDGR